MDRVINGYPASNTKNIMRNNLIFQKNFIYLALTLILASIFLIFNFQTAYSQIPEVSYLDVNDTSSVSKFSAAAWFKTSANYDSDAYIVNKPGSSNNLNYGIWMTSAENLRGGFETSGGSPMYATSPQSYSDGKWHYVTVTYDGSNIILYADGVQVATKKTSGSPDTGDEPVRVGADSTTLGDYFIGNVDEIRVWSVALTPLQVSDAYHDNADTKNQELYLDFSEPIEMLNVTSVALNQTALNQTALNQTALNQTDIPVTNDTATTNDTSTRVNGTLPNQTGIIPEPSIENDTGIDNETSTNIAPLQEIPSVNETGITNETQDSDLTETEQDTTNETSTEQSTGTSALEQTNQPPNANGGNDISVEVNTQVELDGGQSTDEDGQIVSYKWEQTGGPEINLEQPNEQKAGFDVPESAADSTLTFILTVVDDKDASDSDEVTVEVKSAVTETDTNNQQSETETDTNNQQTETEIDTSEQQTETQEVEEQNVPPKADAGGNQNAEVNTEVKLDGGQSSDEDGEIASYKWEQSDGPEVDLKNADEQTASFDVPESAADSKLTFKLTVVDDKDASDSDDTSVEVQGVPEDSSEESDSRGNSGESE